jgi:hypothetical protein
VPSAASASARTGCKAAPQAGDAGLPAEFHQAAADIYQRMADFKGADPLPSLEQVLAVLINKSDSSLKTND